MSDHDAFAERGRALENEYFKNKDRELIERMRKAAAAKQAHSDLSRTSGLTDPALVQDLLDLGFTPDTISLLPLLPVLEIAWAEGGITAAERDLIVRLARSRGITENSAADRQLTEWMATRPDARVFERAGRLIAATLASTGQETATLSVDDLVQYCEKIAAASGGILGLGKISPEERALLSRITVDLKTRQT
ncbi:MAG TPA: hypothetical protein VI485_00800 [Vicinamibacterales bacterium]|nr:hypothetical protein [Vicinamibacterales bacterium]